MAKINQEWRTILRNIKCAELRTEVKSLQKYFEDAFQRKNQTIDRLLFELDETEEMYATMLRSHMKAIDKLIGRLIIIRIEIEVLIKNKKFPFFSSMQ